jgi:hypothetical protein
VVVNVLFDHNMPPSIARAVHELVNVDGHQALALRQKFPVNVSDVDLYERLGREKNWVVLSKDVAQARRRPEREAILRYGVVAIYLAPSVEKQPPWQQAATILWHWQAIVSQRASQANGLSLLPVNKRAKFRSL